MKDEEFTHQLDQIKNILHTAPAYLAPRILANLPSREPLERVFAWFGVSLWRSATATFLPLLLGFSLGISNTEYQDAWYETETLLFVDALEEYDYDEI